MLIFIDDINEQELLSAWEGLQHANIDIEEYSFWADQIESKLIEIQNAEQKKAYTKPKMTEIATDKTIAMNMKSYNGAGKRPPGWENPHNPHYRDNINDNPFNENPLAMINRDK